ncbi:MFS transporter [Streptomyces sp. NBC_01408]|uniref:MFS transporter n=1 Tax=Streptomyces sp. NBC_01408 TaxID=2903855 RepID=UPI002256D522|nr:MFS transporter [Streptomyces sp. NBC_01408]MCX4696552.1 MFS transporter [Streptomyces sp. NBC_01408]
MSLRTPTARPGAKDTAAPDRPAPRPERSVAPVVTAISLLGMLVVGQLYVAIPLLPEVGRAWGVDQASATWATSAYAATYAVISLFSGALARRFGTRTVLVAGVAALAAATACVPLAESFGAGLSLRAAQGLFAGVYVPLVYAYLNAHVPASKLPTALTIVSACMAGTIVIGQVESQLLAAVVGWRGTFWVTAPLLLAGALVLRRVLSAVDPARTADRASAPGGGPGRLWKRLLPLYVVGLTCSTTMTAVYTSVQLYGPPELVGDGQAMLMLRATAIPALVLGVLVAPLLGRIPARPRGAGAFAVAAAGICGAGLFGGTTAGLATSMFVFMLGVAAIGPAVVQEIGTAAGTAHGVMATALYGFTLNIGGGLGAQLPLAFGEVRGVGLFMSALLGGCVVLLVVSGRRPAPARPAVPPT